METRYTLRGAFEGDVAILADSIEIRLARGLLVNSLRMRVPHQRIFADVQIAALLAETQGGRWRPRVSSRPIPIASVMAADTSTSFDSLRLVIPRPRDLDPRRVWLVFRITARELPGAPTYQAGNDEFATYACEAEYLVRGATQAGVAPPRGC